MLTDPDTGKSARAMRAMMTMRNIDLATNEQAVAGTPG